jgi:hypothetical protein
MRDHCIQRLGFRVAHICSSWAPLTPSNLFRHTPGQVGVCVCEPEQQGVVRLWRVLHDLREARRAGISLWQQQQQQQQRRQQHLCLARQGWHLLRPYTGGRSSTLAGAGAAVGYPHQQARPHLVYLAAGPFPSPVCIPYCFAGPLNTRAPGCSSSIPRPRPGCSRPPAACLRGRRQSRGKSCVPRSRLTQ